MVEVETGQASHLLLEVDGRIIGEGRMAPRIRVMGVLGIKIIGEYQGRRLGTALMGVLEEEARKMELQQIYLTVFANNTPGPAVCTKSSVTSKWDALPNGSVKRTKTAILHWWTK